MKARLLVGLLTVALGGLTSCSNILEENGVINNVAESGMGELRINLSTDASLNVSTKGVETASTVTINQKTYTINLGNFDINATPSKTENIIITGKANEFPKPVAADIYEVTATLDQMEGATLNWDKPSFSGSESATVTKAGSITAEINAKLSNSIITIDQTNWNALTEKATISNIFVYQGNEKYDSSNTNIFTLYDGTEFTTDKNLFVAANRSDVFIYIEGTVNDASNTRFSYSMKIAGDNQTETTVSGDKTVPAKNYKVKYTIVTEKGELSLKIKLDEKVIEVPLTVEVDPYKESTTES